MIIRILFVGMILTGFFFPCLIQAEDAQEQTDYPSGTSVQQEAETKEIDILLEDIEEKKAELREAFINMKDELKADLDGALDEMKGTPGFASRKIVLIKKYKTELRALKARYKNQMSGLQEKEYMLRFGEEKKSRRAGRINILRGSVNGPPTCPLQGRRRGGNSRPIFSRRSVSRCCGR